jgi:hypothetical protein
MPSAKHSVKVTYSCGHTRTDRRASPASVILAHACPTCRRLANRDYWTKPWGLEFKLLKTT